MAAGRQGNRRDRQRQRGPRRGPDAVQARRRPAGLRNPGQRLRRPEGLPGHGRARLRPPRPGPGEVHPAGAARAVPLQGRGHHPLRRGLRVRRGIGPARSRATTRPRPWWAPSPTGSPSSPRTSPSSRPPAACTCTSCTARWRSTTTPTTPGRVAGIKFERTELDGTGNARGTGEFVDYPVQAVYRAIGYFGSSLPEVEFDHSKGVVPNDGGRVLDAAGTHVPGIYATGWIKRGPVGLIGHTKGDALETVTYLLEDRAEPAAGRSTRAGGDRRTPGEPRRAVHQLGRLAGPGRARAGPRRRRPAPTPAPTASSARAHQGGPARGHGGDFPRRGGRRGLISRHHTATRGHSAPVPEGIMGRE